MPPDRIVTVRIRDEGTWNIYGEFEPGAVNEYRVWATRMDQSLVDDISGGGLRVIADKAFRLRWRADVAMTTPDRVEIVEDGQVYNVENIVEVKDTRRRFLDIQVIAEVGAP